MIEINAEFIKDFITFTFPFLICIMSPGPDFALIVRNSVMYSRRTGLLTAFGTSLGLTFHGTYTLIGLAVILKQSEYVFFGIKILGALYLLYLGVTSFFKKSAVMDEMTEIDEAVKAEHKKDLTPFQAIRLGFLTDVLNPFAAVFFISVFSLVLDPGTTMPVKIFFGSEIFILGLLWFGSVAWFFSIQKVRLQFARMGMWFGRLTGSVLFYYGLRLAFMSSP